MDLWLQLWLREAAPGSPSSNLEKTGKRELGARREGSNKYFCERNPKINADIK